MAAASQLGKFDPEKHRANVYDAFMESWRKLEKTILLIQTVSDKLNQWLLFAQK